MKILSCSLVLYLICSPVESNGTTNHSNSTDHATNNFWQLFSKLFFTKTSSPSTSTTSMTTNRIIFHPRIQHAYMPKSNRMYKNKVYRNYVYRRYPTTSLPDTTASKDKTKVDYDYKGIVDQIIKEAPRLKEAIDNIFELNITIPPELYEGLVTRLSSPYIIKVTLPPLQGNFSNFSTDKPLPNRGFLKLKGGLADMFQDGDMRVLFREIADQLSQAFNMSSADFFSESPIVFLDARMHRRRKMAKPITTQSTLPAYLATNYKIRVRTRGNVTIPEITDNVINFADYTKYFENY